MALLGHILFSGSKDCSLRSWDLRNGRSLHSVTDHRDYVQSIVAKDNPETGDGIVVTGGAADHLVIVYDTDDQGALKCRHKLCGKISKKYYYICAKNDSDKFR